MKVVVAVDSFKGSMSSMKAGRAVEQGILRVYPQAHVDVCALADGGEGTIETLVEAAGGSIQNVEVAGPLGEPIACRYGVLHNNTAVIETAEAAGLSLLPPHLRNPFYTTTRGLGEIIKNALERGCRKFIIGLGGSATNDGGIGMLQALGFEFSDSRGQAVPAGAKGVEKLAAISAEHILPELGGCEFRVACDVKNPLYGPEGCSAVFGPQKGADELMVRQMDEWMRAYAELTKKNFASADPFYPGTGAAGGLGFAFLVFLNAYLESGIEIVLRETRLKEKIKEADIVVTGEGHLDGQTVLGKAPAGVAGLAQKYGKPVIAFAGGIGTDAGICNEKGIDAYFSILSDIVTLEEAMNIEKAERNMANITEQVFRIIRMTQV